MNETQVLEYLRKIIQHDRWDKLKDGSESDWQTWLDTSKIRDKGLIQFVKLLIRLEVLIPSEENSHQFKLHKDSWKIARDYLENNIQSFQTLILLYDINRSRSKKTQ